MATRSRTEEFFQLRNSRPRRRPDTQPLTEPTTVFVPPMWVGQMDEIRAVQAKMNTMQKELEELQKNHLRVHFGATRDEEQEELQIEQVTAKLSGMFKQTEKMIQGLEAVFLNEVDDQGGTAAEMAILRNVKMCLANEIAKQTRAFTDNQRKYLAAVQKQKGIISKGVNEEAKAVRDALARDALVDGYRQRGMTQEQIDTILMNKEQVDGRLREFEQISNSIKTLHEMFQDLNTLVIEQGTVLDRIDANMQMTHQRVKKGGQELKKAAEHQKAGCFKLMLLFLVVLIIALMLALAVKVIG